MESGSRQKRDCRFRGTHGPSGNAGVRAARRANRGVRQRRDPLGRAADLRAARLRARSRQDTRAEASGVDDDPTL